MRFFELENKDISDLDDGDLRELVARLCEAELIQQGIQPICVTWGGAQEAPDGGLDVHVKNAGILSNPSFVPRENTGFQVKKNSMGKAACTKEMLDNGSIKNIIENLASISGAYIIVSGKDDCSDKMLSERVLGMQTTITDSTHKGCGLLTDFYGRDRLAAWLRQHPGVTLWVRTRLGKPILGWMPFGRWAATPSNQDDEFLLDNHPCVIDANSQEKEPVALSDGIKLARDRLRGTGSTVRITGLSGVGKTRFAQALFETNVGEDALQAVNVIYADLGDNLTPTASELITYLIANDFATYVVLDNCPPDVHRQLQKQVSQSNSKLRLLTIEYDISDDRPEETEVIHLEPSSEETVSKLIQKRFSDLGRYNSDKIAEFSGGNARVALALASRVDADETLTNFTDEALFHRLFSQRKGISDNLLEGAEILSLVYSFNISKTEHNDEIGVLATICGLERRELSRSHAELLRRQLSQQRGNWRAVLPHALANRLTRRALQNIAPDEINKELFKRENLRLFKSCAHRLGYLHDFGLAKQLADTWIQPGGPFHDIVSCDRELLVALGHVAPVFPGTVLTAFESASMNPIFATRKNKSFSTIITILCKLAYEDERFDRSAKIILKFAETEKLGENNNSIVHMLRHLFSLHLSGTHATPTRRQAFLASLLVSGNLRHKEIANELFRSAFQTSQWFSTVAFDFGARKRDSGWVPKTNEESINWYTGFINILKPNLNSKDIVCKNQARILLAQHFRTLWTFAGCFDLLEKIVIEHAYDGSWPEMWMSIKQTISFDAQNHRPELLTRLETLENSSAPADLFSEILAYAFTNTWDHIEARHGDYNKKSKNVLAKIVKLGELAALETGYLDKLAPRLWEKNIDSLWFFGEGLAKGCSDRHVIFEYLVGLMQDQRLEYVDPGLFGGFIHAVYSDEPKLAQRLQERVLEIPELKFQFVYLLGSAPITLWGVKKLKEIARAGEFEAWRFEQIKYAQIHKPIFDADLIEILDAVNMLDDGVFSTINILVMRFFKNKNCGYTPSDALQSFGLDTICKLLSMHRDKIGKNRDHQLKVVVEECLSTSAPVRTVVKIIGLVFDGIESYRLYDFEIKPVICALLKNFPELLLNHIYENGNRGEFLADNLFSDRTSDIEPSLNLVSEERLIKWCNGEEGKIQAVAGAIEHYSVGGTNGNNLDHPKCVVLSSHTKILLDVAEDKLSVAELIFNRIYPNSWTGELSNILETRSKAFAELLDSSSLEVREYAKGKLVLIEQSINKNREQEAKESNRHEQRFE